jgi:hypothetical protein
VGKKACIANGSGQDGEGYRLSSTRFGKKFYITAKIRPFPAHTVGGIDARIGNRNSFTPYPGPEDDEICSTVGGGGRR